MPTFTLTEQHKAFFNTFGYLCFPGLLNDIIGDIINEFEGVWKARGGGHGGKPHDGNRRSCIVQFVDQTPRLSALLDDPRILAIAKGLLGDDFNYMGSDGNYYAGDTGWHSDGWHRPPDLHLKMALYLDKLTRDTGCLRVIPGSHVEGDKYAGEVTRHLGRLHELLGIEGKDVPCLALETNPGDLAVFNHNTKHAAFGGGGWRRMFTMNLCRRYSDDRLQVLRDYISGHARFWVDRNYGPVMMDTAGPERRRHLEQVMANDGHLKGLADKARREMPEPSRG